MKKYSKEDQKILAAWSVNCAEHVLPLFEKIYPDDDRPRKAIEVCRAWVKTGVFKMTEIRGASLSAHAAARMAVNNKAACFAARAAGQAVATAHVSQHAYGGAYYALKAVAALDTLKAEARINKELIWQSRRLPDNLRHEIISRIIIEKRVKGMFIGIDKRNDF